MIAGVDGCKGGWMAALEDTSGGTAVRFVASFGQLLEDEDLAVLAVDVPIGLPETGARECDLLARKRLGPRRNAVFPAPIRPALAAASWEEACAIRERIEGKRYSKQAFGIFAKIGEVDSSVTPELQSRVREGHPEVSFALLAGHPMAHYKGKAAGREERVELLEPVFPDLRTECARFSQRTVVDVLDAFALLWTARRIRVGEAITLPAHPPRDSRGLRMEMFA